MIIYDHIYLYDVDDVYKKDFLYMILLWFRMV